MPFPCSCLGLRQASVRRFTRAGCAVPPAGLLDRRPCSAGVSVHSAADGASRVRTPGLSARGRGGYCQMSFRPMWQQHGAISPGAALHPPKAITVWQLRRRGECAASHVAAVLLAKSKVEVERIHNAEVPAKRPGRSGRTRSALEIQRLTSSISSGGGDATYSESSRGARPSGRLNRLALAAWGSNRADCPGR